ncbi:MAG TPA: hypothetical protein DCF68_06270, partial [Cyanothece sp. UBA12306]|nr:hypothetical protein [Cyanothece sp. UBA12306]
MSPTRLQDEYNKAITKCDVFVSLFKTKVGRYTDEEFMTALSTFKTQGKLLIYTYFKEVTINPSQINREDLISLQSFQDKLSNLGHFYTIYKNIEDLKYRFSEQLNKFIPTLTQTEEAEFNSIEQLKTQVEASPEPQPPQPIQKLQEINKPISNQKTEEIELKSEKEVDYTKLRELLAAGKWKEADQETARVMLQATNRVFEGYLDEFDIDNFPC